MAVPPTASTALVIGTVGFDTIETPEGRHENLLGGSAWFGALAASFFAPVELVAAVGYDFTERHRAILKERSVGLDGLFTSPDKLTFAWAARYGEGFATRETTGLELNALVDFHPDIPEAARDARFAMLCNFEPRLQVAALDQLSPDCFVMLDTIDFWIREEREAVSTLVKRCGLLLVNDEEALLLTGERDGIKAGHALIAEGAGAVIVKRGGDGSLLVHPEGTFDLSVCQAETLRDPTGAGDTYGGAILGCLARAGEASFAAIKDAMTWGAALASFTVEDFSSNRLLAVTPEELEKRRGLLRL